MKGGAARFSHPTLATVQPGTRARYFGGKGLPPGLFQIVSVRPGNRQALLRNNPQSRRQLSASKKACKSLSWSHVKVAWIVESALKNRHRQFVIDGEAVVLGVNGVADFNALRSSKRDHQVQFYAFDIMAPDGGDLRSLSGPVAGLGEHQEQPTSGDGRVMENGAW